MEENKNIEEVLFEEVDRENEKHVEPYFDVLPIKNTVLFPDVLMPIAVSKKSSLKFIKAANKDNRRLILLTQKDDKVAEPKADDLFTTGVMAHVLQIIPVPEMGKDTMMAIFESYHRVQASDFKEEDGQLKANAFVMEEGMPLIDEKLEFKATAESIRETARKHACRPADCYPEHQGQCANGQLCMLYLHDADRAKTRPAGDPFDDGTCRGITHYSSKRFGGINHQSRYSSSYG